jgi:hypothetical protein
MELEYPMESIDVVEMDVKRFNALAGHSRSPAVEFVSRELAWYSNPDETVLGVILFDIIDEDYAAVVLGKDEGGRFRAFDNGTSMRTAEEATKWLLRVIKWHTGRGKKIFPQGESKKGLDLFSPVVPTERQHAYFIALNSDSRFLPARAIISHMMPHFIDIDGNFIEQFQTTGFDSRVWELYLDSYLTEEQLFIDRTHNAPDFIVEKYGERVAIEAVIVGRKADNPPTCLPTGREKVSPMYVAEQHDDAMPIRFGSPLYSKLLKKYWDLPHVKGNPIVFAIADFHDDLSMLWSSTALINYLYGYTHEFHYDTNNKLVIIPKKINVHRVGNKEIPSGFFFQPNSEHVSAILFSASGTISKFNRLGRQAGFHDPSVIMIRHGTYHDHDPDACIPKVFSYTVDENSQETWGEGLSMFHNPRAVHPVPEELFPSIAHHHFDNGQIVSSLPEFHVYASVTMNIKVTK